MEDELVSFETAKLAKQKGFDIVTVEMYGSQKVPQLEPYNQTRWVLYRDYYMAPTQTNLQKWLRETHNIYVSIKYKPDEIINRFELSIYEQIYHRHTEIYATYESALEEGLKQGLTLIEI